MSAWEERISASRHIPGKTLSMVTVRGSLPLPILSLPEAAICRTTGNCHQIHSINAFESIISTTFYRQGHVNVSHQFISLLPHHNKVLQSIFNHGFSLLLAAHTDTYRCNSRPDSPLTFLNGLTEHENVLLSQWHNQTVPNGARNGRLHTRTGHNTDTNPSVVAACVCIWHNCLLSYVTARFKNSKVQPFAVWTIEIKRH